MIMKKFAVDPHHRDYFQKQHTIEFEELISEPHLKELRNDLANLLSKAPPAKHFEEGRDLWRRTASFKRLARNVAFAEIAADLTNHTQLRLGLDQFFPPFEPSEPPYSNYLKGGFSLAESSSIQGVVCGLMLCLKAPSKPNEQPSQLFSAKAGNGIFFDPNWLMPLQEKAGRSDGEYLLIVYAEPNAVYIQQQNDPLTHLWKGFDYVYGDKLKEKTHPLVLKSSISP